MLPKNTNNMPASSEDEQLWTLADFCRWANIPLSGGRSLVFRRQLPVVRIGRRLRIIPEVAKAAFIKMRG